MLTWQRLKTFSYSNPPRVILGRSDEVNETYTKHRILLEKQEIDVSTFILGKYFMNNDEYNGKKFVFDKNMFPYLCEDNIEHNILWIHDSIELNDEVLEKIKRLICHKYFTSQEDMDKNCVYFRNIEQLRSVKGVPHIHIFVRDRNRQFSDKL